MSEKNHCVRPDENGNIKIDNYLRGSSALVIQLIESAYLEVHSNCGYFGEWVATLATRDINSLPTRALKVSMGCRLSTTASMWFLILGAYGSAARCRHISTEGQQHAIWYTIYTSGINQFA